MDFKNKINFIRESKEGKVLMSNFAYLSLLQVAGYIFPLMTLPYLANVIGVDCFGKLAFAASIIVYFETFTRYGFDYLAVRDIARNRENVKEVSKIYSNVIFAQIVLMIISIILLFIITLIDYFREYRVILWLTFLYIPGHIMFPTWLFQGLEKMKYVTVMNFLSKLIFTLLVFVFVKEKSDYIYQPILIAFGFFISGAISMIIIYKKLKISLCVPSCKDIFLLIKSNTNMFICLFLPNFYSSFSVTLLGVYGSLSAVGMFSSGKKFVDLCNEITSILSRVFYPFLARRIDKHYVYVRISLVMSLIMGLFLFLCADLLVRVFLTEEFSNAAIVIRIMSIAPFFLFLMNTYGNNYLVLLGKENVLRNIIIVSSLFGFVLVWIMAVKFDYIGVAISVTLIWGLRGVLTWIYAKRRKKI